MHPEAAPHDPPAATEERSALGPRIALAATLLFVALVRVRLLDVPLERDEGEYAYGGQLLLRGEPMYAHLYTMKLPGTHAAYALGMAAFGETIAGVHLGFLVANAAAIVLVYLLGRRLADERSGAVAAAAYAVLSLSPSLLGLSAHATHFVVLAALGGLLLLLRALERGRLLLFGIAGFVSGLAPLMKQSGALLVAFAGLWLVVAEARRRPRALGAGAMRALAFAVGAAVPLAVTLALVQRSGAFEQFWYWTVDYSREYVAEASISDGLSTLAYTRDVVAKPVAALLGLALVGLCVPLLHRGARAGAAFRTSFLVASFLAVCPGLWFRPHYFVLMLPAVALLVATAVRSLGAWLANGPAVLSALPAVILAGAIVHPLAVQSSVLFTLPPRVASRAMYGAGSNPFPEALDAAEFLKLAVSPGDRIAVIGSEPEIYFYTSQIAPTGYIYTYALAEKQRFAEAMQAQMEAELTAAKPRFLVLLWSEPALPRSIGLYEGRYEVIGALDTPADASPSGVWFDAARAHVPTTEYCLLVLRRRP